MKRFLFLLMVVFALSVFGWCSVLAASEKETAAEPVPVSTTVPDSESCRIKGNVNSKGEKIYHCPNWRDYKKTKIKPEEGDKWFCTEAEAKKAGFRAPLYKHGVCRP